MYRNRFYLLSDDCINLIYFVEDTYTVAREKGNSMACLDENSADILRIGNETIITIKNKYSFILTDELMSLVKKLGQIKISVNRLGDEEIITEHTFEIPQIFIGQLIAYARL